MKLKCLKCGKEFESPTGRAKFCSDSCRVMYHRKNTTAKAKEKSVHNLIMENLGEFRELRKQMMADLSIFGMYRSDGKPIDPNFTPETKFKISPVKSFEYYRAAKKEIELEEDWLKMKEEITAAPNLSEKQKNILLTTNI